MTVKDNPLSIHEEYQDNSLSRLFHNPDIVLESKETNVAIISNHLNTSITKEKIAVGGYGAVYKVTSQESVIRQRSLAYKSVKIKEKGIRFLMEVSIMCTYRHPSLVHALHVEIIEKEGEYIKLRIYQELAKCDMRKYIEDGKYRFCVNTEKLRTHFLEVCSGIRFLHINNIIHGDIKSKNVLIYPVNGQEDIVKICDFDCSTIATKLKKEHRGELSGTIKYNAPEILIDSKNSLASDIWSLGCLLYEMASGKILVPENDSIKNAVERAERSVKAIQLWRASEGDIIYDELGDYNVIPIVFELGGHIAKIVKSIMKYAPEDRPTITKVIKKMGGAKVKTRNVKLYCQCVYEDEVEKAKNAIKDYIATREYNVPDHVVDKASGILSTTVFSLVNIETSLLMSCKLHRCSIQHYHPISKEKKIVKAEIEICVNNSFQIHKFCSNDLYIIF